MICFFGIKKKMRYGSMFNVFVHYLQNMPYGIQSNKFIKHWSKTIIVGNCNIILLLNGSLTYPIFFYFTLKYKECAIANHSKRHNTMDVYVYIPLSHNQAPSKWLVLPYRRPVIFQLYPGLRWYL